MFVKIYLYKMSVDSRERDWVREDAREKEREREVPRTCVWPKQQRVLDNWPPWKTSTGPLAKSKLSYWIAARDEGQRRKANA